MDKLNSIQKDDILLEIKDLYYNSGKKEILKGIDLTISSGNIYSIIGVNGTGKTTLAAIIMGLNGYMPTSGKIVFNGTDITKLSVSDRAKLGITLAWQIPANFEGITVKEYLNLKKDGVEPEKCLRLVGLSPDSFLSRTLNENLSGGERKRIELASVISMRPKLAILDEPDSGIDMASISGIRKAIKSFKKIGATIVLITHNEDMANLADHTFLICDGKIVKEGMPNDVRKFFKKYCKRCDHVGEVREEMLK